MNQYIQKIREIAIDNKYTKWYCNIIENALLRPQNKKILNPLFGYIEKHHILPRSFKLGGETDEENSVCLTGREHFIVHLCLVKMFIGPFKYKMTFALNNMSSFKTKRYFNSKLYNSMRLEFRHSEETKEKMRGKRHSEFTKNKMSKTKLGKPKSMITRRNMSIGRIGMIFSEQHLKNISLSHQKPVKQLDINNNLIKIWPSIRSASYALKIYYGNISRVCLKTRKTAGGFKWEFGK